MTTNDETVEVTGGVRTVYNQWTQFETYRYFMEGVQSVARTGPTTTHWVVADGRATREFDAEIIEEVTGRRLAWAATTGPTYTGVVTLYPVDDTTTRIRLETEIEGRAVNPSAPTAPGTGRQPQGDLDRFKDYLEASGDETGAWQGFVDRDR